MISKEICQLFQGSMMDEDIAMYDTEQNMQMRA